MKEMLTGMYRGTGEQIETKAKGRQRTLGATDHERGASDVTGFPTNEEQRGNKQLLYNKFILMKWGVT